MMTQTSPTTAPQRPTTPSPPTSNLPPPTPSLTSNCSWGGVQVERGDGRQTTKNNGGRGMTGMDGRMTTTMGTTTTNRDNNNKQRQQQQTTTNDDDGDRVTPLSKLQICFLYTLQTLSEHHNTYLDFILHFQSSSYILQIFGLFRTIFAGPKYLWTPPIPFDTLHSIPPFPYGIGDSHLPTLQPSSDSCYTELRHFNNVVVSASSH
jgi:hypothetical protein